MLLIDQLAEQHILEAQKNGDFDNLPGSGKKLNIDDDSHIPEQLRGAYRILKNSGFLPPELEMRREAIELNEVLAGIDSRDEQYTQHSSRLALLTIKLRRAGLSTDFLQSRYATRLYQRFSGEE